MPIVAERYFQIVVISGLAGEPRERVAVPCLSETGARRFLSRYNDGTTQRRAEAWEIPLARLKGDRRRKLV